MNYDLEKNSEGSILVVDDSPDNLRVLSMNLTECGYKVRCVTNGEMALVSVSYLLPDLILLDIRMPTIDGYEVCRQLKENPATRDIPIIFLSAADDVAGKVKAFKMGGVDYITKPFQTEEVLARIANQLTIQRLQKRLVEQNQRLQQEIDAHKQTEAALQDAKEAAETANYTRSEFLARMSHELRTPLNVILGFAGLMENDSSLSEEHQDYISSINRSAQELLKLLNHILTVTSTESSKVSLNKQVFNLYPFLEAIALAVHSKAQAKGLQLCLECAPNIPRSIQSDENKLRQVLMNLLENAVQFTQVGKVVLRVSVGKPHAQDWENPEPSLEFPHTVPLIFEIEDTGSGISSEEVNNLFQAFLQTEAGRKSQQGAGLGLFISRQFVQGMGGEISISSTLGQGTIVRFYILIHPIDINSGLEFDSELLLEDQSSDRPRSAVQVFSESPLIFTEEQIMEALQTGMSIDWLTQLHHAAVKGFDHQITQLIQEIPEPHLSLTRVLTDWNQNFQFDRIVTVTQHVLEQTS